MSTLLAVGRLANVSLLVCTCYVDKVLVKNKTKKKHAGEKIECYVKLKIFMYGHLCMDIYIQKQPIQEYDTNGLTHLLLY